MASAKNHNPHRKAKYKEHFLKIVEKTKKGKTNKKRKKG